MMQPVDLDLQYNYVIVIIVGYLVAAVCWFVMFIRHFQQGTQYSFSGFGFTLVWMWFAYRNYVFGIEKSRPLDMQDLIYNCAGVLVVLACSILMVMPYFKKKVKS